MQDKRGEWERQKNKLGLNATKIKSFNNHQSAQELRTLILVQPKINPKKSWRVF